MKKILLFTAVLLTACATTRDNPSPTRTESAAVAAAPAAPSDNATSNALPVLPAAPAEPAPAAAPEKREPAPRHLNYRQFVARNDERLIDIYVGMKLEDVERIMNPPEVSRWNNPHRRQTLIADNKPHLVLFYLTDLPRDGQVRENDLTPVIFRDNKVVAIGRYPLKKLRQGIAINTRVR